MTQPQSLGQASARGVLWNGATFGLGKAVVFVTTVITARLLVPDDFGLLGIGLLVIGYLEFVNDFGVSAALIQRKDGSEEAADTAFWLNIALGITLTAVGVAVAPAIAAFFDDDRATDIVRVLSLSFLLTSIGSVHEARLRRDLRFRARVVPELAKNLVKGAVSITLAVLDYGVWALVWGQLAGTVTAALLYWVILRWRPNRRFDRRIARELLGFGSQITLVGLLGGLHKNLDYLLIGRQFDTRALGIYTLAFRMPQLLVESVVGITSQVVFPAFSRVQEDPDRLRRGLERMLRITSLVIVPLGLGLALTADPFIRVFYGGGWEEAIPVMRLLALYMLVQSLGRTCGDLYKGMGRPGILNWLALVKLAISAPLLILAVPHGIETVAAAQLGAALVISVIQFAIAARITGMPARSILGSFVPAFRAGIAMAVVCLGVIQLVDDAPALGRLIVITGTGAIVYLGMLALTARDTIGEVAELVGGRKNRTRTE